MNSWRFALLPVLVACSLSGCSEGAKPNTHQIVGRISDDAVAQFASAPSSVSVLKVTSQGGDTLAAIELARIMRQRRVKLVVERYCLSACAQWLLPAALEVELIDDAVVGFHHTATAFRDILLEANEDTEALLYQSTAEAELDFYREIGVDRRLLTYPYKLTEPFCFIRSADSGSEFAQFAARWNFVVITKEEFAEFVGKAPNGDWPEEQQDLEEAASRNIPESVSLSIRTPSEGDRSSHAEPLTWDLEICEQPALP